MQSTAPYRARPPTPPLPKDSPSAISRTVSDTPRVTDIANRVAATTLQDSNDSNRRTRPISLKTTQLVLPDSSPEPSPHSASSSSVGVKASPSSESSVSHSPHESSESDSHSSSRRRSRSGSLFSSVLSRRSDGSSQTTESKKASPTASVTRESPASAPLPDWLVKLAVAFLDGENTQLNDDYVKGLDPSHRMQLLGYFRGSLNQARAQVMIGKIEAIQTRLAVDGLLFAIIQDTNGMREALSLSNESIIPTEDLFTLIYDELKSKRRSSEQSSQLSKFCSMWLQTNRQSKLFRPLVQQKLEQIAQHLSQNGIQPPLDMNVAPEARPAFSSLAEAPKNVQKPWEELIPEIAKGKKDLHKYARKIAQDLKFYQLELALAMRPNDFVKDKHAVEPASLQRSDFWKSALYFFVAETVVKQQKVEERVRLVRFFLLVCRELVDLGDFSTCHAIFRGLNNAALKQLQKTWASLRASSQDAERFDDLKKLFLNPREHSSFKKEHALAFLPILREELESKQSEPARLVDRENRYSLEKLLRICHYLTEELRTRARLLEKERLKMTSDIVKIALQQAPKSDDEEKERETKLLALADFVGHENG